jgi:hypothetical protein
LPDRQVTGEKTVYNVFAVVCPDAEIKHAPLSSIQTLEVRPARALGLLISLVRPERLCDENDRSQTVVEFIGSVFGCGFAVSGRQLVFYGHS